MLATEVAGVQAAVAGVSANPREEFRLVLNVSSNGDTPRATFGLGDEGLDLILLVLVAEACGGVPAISPFPDVSLFARWWALLPSTSYAAAAAAMLFACVPPRSA